MNKQQVTHLNKLSLVLVVDTPYASKNKFFACWVFFVLLLSSAADFFQKLFQETIRECQIICLIWIQPANKSPIAAMQSVNTTGCGFV